MPPVESYVTFTHAKQFDAAWAGLALGEEALLRLQVAIANDLEVGDVVEGTNGLRKVRLPAAGRGKSGGVRVCYAAFPAFRRVLLFGVYAKNRKADLSVKEKKRIAALIVTFQQRLAKAQGSGRGW